MRANMTERHRWTLVLLPSSFGRWVVTRIVNVLTPLALRVMCRIRCLNRSSDFGANVHLMSGPAVKLNPGGPWRPRTRHR
jgi:hypothetical protein